MANNAIVGAGAVLQLSISGTLTTITDIVAINGCDTEVDDIDVTNLLSPSVFKEYLPGWGEGGVVTMEANFAPTQFNILYGTIRMMQVWRMIFSNGSKWDFSGYINALGTENPLEEQVHSPFTIKVTGKPTFTQ